MSRDRLNERSRPLVVRSQAVDEDEDEYTESDRAAARRASNADLHRHMLLQRKAAGAASSPQQMHAAAARGTATTSQALPHADRIQASFGPEHDVSNIRAHVDHASTHAMGADAYATGNDVVFAGAPDLHTAAHEAAHVVQQSQGVNLYGGIGEPGDVHEQRADAVADRVVRGQSARDLLGPPTKGASPGAGSAIQHKDTKKNKQATAPSQPTMIDAADAYEHLKEGQQARLRFLETKEMADVLYSVIVSQAKAATIHEQAKDAYDDTRKTRGKMLEKSTIEKVFTAITTLVQLGTTIHGIMAAAGKMLDAAEGLNRSYTKYQQVKDLRSPLNPSAPHRIPEEAEHQVWKHGMEGGGAAVNAGMGSKDVYEKSKTLHGDLGGSSPEAPDTGTMLSDANAAAINAGNEALQELVKMQTEFNLVTVHAAYRAGALDLSQMVEGVALLTKSNKVMPDDSIKSLKQLIAQGEAAQREAHVSVTRLRDLWKAYLAGGAEAVSDPRERGLFETIQAWKSAGDPKLGGVRLAMDQATKHIKFSGFGHAFSGPLNAPPIRTTYHLYEEQFVQAEQGTLYISDAAVAKELLAAGLVQYDTSMAVDAVQGGPGAAEKEADKLGGQKFTISISLCKALASLGVANFSNDASIHLWNNGTPVARISNPHRGDWYDTDWMNTVEFASFWVSSLRAQAAFVGTAERDKLRQIGFASAEQIASSRDPNSGVAP